MSMQPAGRKSKLSALSLTFLMVFSGLVVLPLVSTPVAAVAPAVMSEWYQDTDCNGHVDAVTLRMTQPVHDVSIRPSDFRIDYGTYGIKEANGFMTGVPTLMAPCDLAQNSANRPTASCTSGAANNDCFTLLFPEGLVPDAGPQSNGGNLYSAPIVTFVNDPNAPVYTEGDPVGSKMTNLGPCPATCKLDASPPLLLAAYAKPGDAFVTVVFSENVAITSGGVNAAPGLDDFCVRNPPPNTVSGAPGSGFTTVNSVPANTFPNRVYRLGFLNAANAPVAIPDQAALSNMKVVVGSVGYPGSGELPCNTDLGDTTNPANHNVVPYSVVYVGAPTIDRFYASAGDDQIIAEFNGPVWDGSVEIPGNSFTVVSAGGSGLTGLNSAITATAGSDRARLTATSLPNLADVAGMGTTTSPATGQLVNANAHFGGTTVGSTVIILSGTAAGTYTVSSVVSSTVIALSSGVNVPSGSPYILSEAGARMHINPGKIVGYRASGVQEPESSTDTTTGCADNLGPAAGVPPASPQLDFCLVDAFNSHSAPKVEQYITQDADNDGCIDNIKVVWSENMLDSSFPPAGSWQVIFPSGLPTTSITLPYGDAAGGGIRRPATMVTADPGTLAPSANDQLTYLVFSDDCGMLRAQGTADSTTSTTLTDANPTEGTVAAAQAGDVLQVTSGTGAGTYSVQSVSGNTVTFSPAATLGANPTYTIMTARTVGNTGTLPVVSFCDGQGDASRSAVCSGPQVMTDLRGNRMLSGSQQGGTATISNYVFRHPTVDGAKPVATYAYAEDATRDGYIDRVTVGFSEGISPGSVTANAWTATIRSPRPGCPLADGTTYDILSVNTGQADPTNGQTPSPTIGTSITPNPVIEFTLRQKSGLNPFGDTGCFPDLTYNGAIREVSTRTAGAPQTMNPIVAGGAGCPTPPSIGGAGPMSNNILCESDGAQPVFQNGKAIGTVNTNVAYVTFSEPVFGSGAPVTAGSPAGNTCGLPSQDPTWPSGLLTPADFSYDDNSNGGVTGISAVTMVGNDCRKWQLTLNGPLSDTDVDGASNPDCLRSRKTSTTVSQGIRDGMPAKAMPSAPSSPRIGNPAVPTEDQFSECIEFTQGPPPLTLVETVDSDHNGGIDAVRLTFTTSVSDPFSAVQAGDSDLGAQVQAPSGGYTMCWVNKAPTALPPGPEDRFYADASGACSGNVAVGDFRYSALPGVRAAGNAVQSGDADLADAFTTGTAILRVPSPGTGTSPNVRDNLYYDADSSGGVTAGDRRVSGFDDRFWDVTIGGVPQVVTGISTGQAARVLPDVATHNPATGTAPTGAACHDSDALLPNAAGDAILYVCIEEQRDGTGKALPNTGAINVKVGYTGSTIVRAGADNPGSPVPVFSDVLAVDAAQPVLVKAVVKPAFGTKTLRDLELTFSEPVVGAAGTKDLQPSDFSYVNGNTASTDCIEGAASVLTTFQAPTVVGTNPVTYIAVRLDGPLSVHDIGNQIAGTGGSVGPACTNAPDSLRAIPGFVKEAVGTLAIYDRAVTFTDESGPQIESAGFVDANGDGIVDAVQVKFNEFINDAGKVDFANRNDWGVRVQTGRDPQTNQPIYQTLEVVDLTTGQLGGGALGGQCQNTYNGGGLLTTGAVSANLRLLPYNATRQPSELVPIAPYGAGANDDHIFLCLNPDKILAGGGTKAAGTALFGALTYTGSVASRLSDVFAAPGFPTGSPMADIPSGTPIPITDMARPVVLNECRRDTTQGGVACPTDMADRSVETADRDGNGAIDAMRVLLSEPIKDDTLNFNQWSVSNVAGLGFHTGSTADDNEIFLTFTQASDSNTGIGRQSSPTIPDVGYFAGGSASDKAAVPNLLRGVTTGTCVAPATGCADERDGAAPTIRQIAAQPGTNLVTVRFSERVGSGTHGTGAITSSHVAYSNAGGSGASAITGISHNGDTLTLTLNGNLDQADVDNDRLVFTDNAIYEAYCGPLTGGVPSTYPHAYPLSGQPNACYRELELAVASRLLNNIVGSPPTAPVLTAGTADEDSVPLTWTVPTDPDNDLASYEVSYCVCPVFFAGGATTVNVPLSSSPSKEITGLVAGQEYSFVVRGIDAAGNRGAYSNEVKVTPLSPDTDAPCAITDLSTGTTTATSVVLSWTVPKEDCSVATSGGPTSYLVAATTGSISSDAGFDAAIHPTSQLAFRPGESPLIAPGTTVTVTVEGLQTGNTYTFAIKAVDDRGKKGPLSNTPTKELGSTDGVNPGAITGLEAIAGDVPSTQVKLRFTAPGDDLAVGRVTSYEVRYAAKAITSGSPGDLAGSIELVPTPPAMPGSQQHIVVKGLKADTEYNFTVKAKDEAGNSGPVSSVVRFRTSAGVDIDLDQVQADFARTVRVSHSGGTNTVTWGDPPTTELGPALGVQVWKLVDGEWTQVADIGANDPEFAEKALQDEGTAGDQYKATVYFSRDASGGFATTPGDIRNFDDLASASASTKILGLEPWLFWLLLGILVLLVIVVAVLLALRAKRARSQDLGDEDEDAGDMPAETAAEGEAMPDAGVEAAPPEDAEPAPAAEAAAPAAAATAAQEAPPASQPQGTPDKHYLTCPKCATEFSAFGIKPLAIQCPNCGVRGTLR